MRRLLAAAGLTLLLAACGGGDEISCETFYWDGNVGSCLPEGWHVVDRMGLDDRGVPAEVVVAFQTDQPVSGQFATVSITLETLDQAMSAAEYSEASIASVRGLPGYTEVDEQDVTIDGEEVTLHEFTAQPRENQPESRFFQLSTVGHDAGYTFTGATPVSIDSELEDQVMLILQSATFTEPEGA